MVELSDGATVWTVVEGSGPPIVLMHGGPGLWDNLDAPAQLLHGDFTVHRWDQRGCGRSGPAPTYGLDVAVSDVVDLKQRWGVDRPWAVVGHSWGAELALLTALRHPEETAALVYVSGRGLQSWWRAVGSAATKAAQAARMTVAQQARLDQLEARERTAAEEIEFRRLAWMTDFADPEADASSVALDAMATSPLPINFAVNRALSRAELFDEAELVAACEACDVPALFVHGTLDPRPVDGARLIADRLPNAHVVELDGAGHHPWIERRDEFVAAVRSFLQSSLG